MSASDGRDLEEIIAFVERTLIPEGGTVETRKRLFLESGVQEVEFDVEVRGKLGSVDVSVLIEARDRPSQGAAPAAWVRELHGKRDQFNFGKVIAVSTTGFAEPAEKAANDLDVELRTVDRLNAEAFGDWLLMTHFIVEKREAGMTKARLLISDTETSEVQAAVREALRKTEKEPRVLKSIVTGEKCEACHAFLGIVEEQGLFDRVAPSGEPLNIGIMLDYVNDENHFVIETSMGDVRIRAIEFDGFLRIIQVPVPVEKLMEYRRADGSPISQVAVFAPHPIMGMLTRMEIHRLPDSGTNVLLRTQKPESDAALEAASHQRQCVLSSRSCV